MPKSIVILALVIETLVLVMSGVISLGFGLGMGMNVINLPWLDKNIILFIVIPLLVLATAVIGPVAIRAALKRGMRWKDLQDLNEPPPEVPAITYLDTLRWLVGETVVIGLSALVYFFFLKSVDSTISVPYASLLSAFSLSVVVGPVMMWMPGDIGLRDGFIYLALSPWTTSSFAALITLGSRLWVSLSEITLAALAGLALSRRINRIKKAAGNPAQLE